MSRVGGGACAPDLKRTMTALHKRLVTGSRAEQIHWIRAWLSANLRLVGVDERDVTDFAIVVSEACGNVARHAYSSGVPGIVILTLDVDEESINLRVRDFGNKFDVEAYRPPMLAQPGEAGYGIHIMRTLMDHVAFDTSQPTGTEVLLQRRRRSG